MIDLSKPRVAVYYFVVPQTNYRNDGGPLFINYNMRKILDGVDSVTGKPSMTKQDGNVLRLHPDSTANKFGEFDLHVWVDHGEDALGLDSDWMPPSPNAYWVSDAHLGYEYRKNMAKKFDYVFVAQKAFIDKFVRDGVARDKIFYLPHAFEPDVYKPIPSIERWDWCFIGHLNSEHRVDLMDRFYREFPNCYLGWRDPQAPGHNSLDDVCAKFNQAKIIVNDSIGDDLNMRTFEALGSGRCLLTQKISELEGELFHMKHLLTYSSIDEAIDMAKWLYAHPEDRLNIAENGHLEAMAKHTYKHRALTILEKTIGWKPEEEANAVAENIAV